MSIGNQFILQGECLSLVRMLFIWDVEKMFLWTNLSLALNLLTIFGAVASPDIILSDT